MDKGIDHLGGTIKRLEATVEDTRKREVYNLERWLFMLGTIAGVAPMIGFSGTVIGIIQVFMFIEEEANHEGPQLLSGDIYEVKITTAANLIVGIVAYFGYNYLLYRVEAIAFHLPCAGKEFVELCKFSKGSK